MGAAIVDELLGTLLRKTLAPYEGSEDRDDLLKRTLQSLDAKATLAYRLGLLDTPTRDMIGQIGRIRNKMAHRFHERSLADGTVKTEVQGLFGLAAKHSLASPQKLDAGLALIKGRDFTAMKPEARRFRLALSMVIVALEEGTVRARRLAKRKPLVAMPK